MFWGHTCLSWKQASSLPVGLGRDTVMEMAALQGELWSSGARQQAGSGEAPSG